MDLDSTLFWLAVISCGALLVRSREILRHKRFSGWLGVCLAILAIAGTGELLFPTVAGRVAGMLWFAFILVPSVLMRVIQRCAAGQHYATARRLAWGVSFLHPADGLRQLPELYRALALARANQTDEAAAALQALAFKSGAPPWLAYAACLNRFRLLGQWEEMLAWSESIPGRDGSDPSLDPSLWVMLLRAWGETGRPDRMLATFEAGRARMERLPGGTVFPMGQLSLFAFTGQEAAVSALCAGPLSVLPGELKTYWIATARMTAGKTEEARAEFRELSARSTDPTLHRAVTRRLTHDLANAGQVLGPAEEDLLGRLEKAGHRDMVYHSQGVAGVRGAPATLALIALNVGVFLLEMARGGSEDMQTLLRLGALWLPAVVSGGQWYRLVAAMFLHFGPLHLGMNMLALIIIGPWVERSLGWVRFVAVYFVTGIGSMAAVLGLMYWGWTRMGVLVGASGAIMGLIGAEGALLASGWRRQRSGAAARRLRGIAFIVATQVCFDLLIPQVSLAGHASGVLIGFGFTESLLALQLSGRSSKERIPSENVQPAER